MFHITKINPMVRAVGTMGAVVALVGGITFASLTSNTVTLADNQLSVTNDILRISNGGAFGTNVTGFNFSNLVINKESAQQPFYFQNTANAALSLGVDVSSTPVVTSVNPALVHINFYDKDGTTVLLSTTLSALETVTPAALAGQLDANAQGNGGVPGTEGNYFVTMEVDSEIGRASCRERV